MSILMFVSDASMHHMWYPHISFALQSLIGIRTYKYSFTSSYATLHLDHAVTNELMNL